MAEIEAKPVSEKIRELAALPGHQYEDLFVASDVIGLGDAEQWARAVLGTTRARLFGQPLWRVALGLRLASCDAPEAIEGWAIGDSGPGWTRVEASSWLLTAHVVFRAAGSERSVSLFVRYRRPPAALVWLPLSVLHQRAVPALMHEALHGVHRERVT